MILSESNVNIIAETIPSIQMLVKDWSENKTPLEKTKLNELLSRFASHLQNSKETIDLNYLESDEAKEIFKEAIESYINENQAEKLQLIYLFLTNFFDKRFSTDKNKLEILTTLEKINPVQAEMIRDSTEWLVLAYGRDVVKQSTDYKPEDINKPYVGYIMESIVAMFSRLTLEKTSPHLDALVKMNVFKVANNGDPIEHFDQTGRGFKPTKLGLQLLDYLGNSLMLMLEKNNFKKQ